jgi:hypothetical protein
MTLSEAPANAVGGLCQSPNAHAPRPEFYIEKNAVVVRGYQNFKLGPRGPEPSYDDVKMLRKSELLDPFFNRNIMQGRSLLDLGANAGFFSFWALSRGAASALAVDMDQEYLALMDKSRQAMQIEGLEIRGGNIADLTAPSDIVTAFALVHWLYSCSSKFGSIEAVISFLAGLTNDLLLIEWIAPEDPAIAFLKHTEFNAACVTGPYTFAAFDAALHQHFEVVEPLGYVEPTRKLFAAWKSRRRQQIDMTSPLPMIHPADRVLTSRRLTPAGGGVTYWSRVYDLGDRIVKQATGNLAAREVEFLAELGGDFFPRVIHFRQEADYSVLVEEKIAGEPLDSARLRLRQDPDALVIFVQGCLEVLARLRELAIVHRDILPGNLLLRNGLPVLLDFGWAQTVDRPFITPHDLGRGLRPPDGSFCDLYSMGKLLQYVCGPGPSATHAVIALMTNPNPTLRVMDIAFLDELFLACIKGIS